LHIGFLTSEYPPLNSGGIGTSISNLGRALVKQGHRVSVLGWGKKTEFNDQGVEVRFLPSSTIPKMGWFLNRFAVAREINRMVREEHLDILEVPDWCGLSAGMRINCPVVIRCHGSDSYFGKLQSYKPRWSVFIAEKWALQSADAITSVSQFTANLTQSIFCLKSPIEIIPNGIDPNQYPVTPGEVEEGLILYFGSIVRKKGVLDLAKIFSMTIERLPQARLLIVGRDTVDKITGQSTWRLMKSAMTEQALIHTQYIGPQPHNQIQKWINKSTVCVFPSYAEAFPVSWLEAMASGKALVASEIGWGPEVIQDGVSGLLINPVNHDEFANAIIRLLTHRAYRDQLGIAARLRVEELFSSDRVAAKNIEWYQKVIYSSDNKQIRDEK